MSTKTILVTGAGGGIGRAVTKRLTEAGFAVIGLDRAEVSLPAPSFTFVRCDITDPDSVRAAYGAVSAVTDTLSGIVNTAGIVFMGSLIEEDAELMQRILDVNVSGMARVNRTFFPLLEKGNGRIVNLSSEYGIFCSIPFHGFYTASKHAVECYTDSLRRELNFLGMKVVGIRPGAVNTPMTHGTVPQFDRIKQTTTHFSRPYRTLAPLMAGATKHPTDPAVIADTVMKALTKKHPRRYYNVRQDVRVRLLSALPTGLTDFIFKRFF